MTAKLSVQERFRRMGERASINWSEAADLAEFMDEFQGHANELECQIGDFAANVEMYETATPDEKADLREQVKEQAEAIANTLESLALYSHLWSP